MFLGSLLTNTDGPTVSVSASLDLEDSPDSEQDTLITFSLAVNQVERFDPTVDPVVVESTQPYVHHTFSITNPGPGNSKIGITTFALVVEQT